ncbi:MAG: hypothetical protein Q4A01_09960 [Coriobacteriales bacterium]|nr:hypothetical protein [Coriobacteriales bacterium]
MAKHLKEQQTQPMPRMNRTVPRVQADPRVQRGEGTRRPLAYGESAPYRTSYVEPAINRSSFGDFQDMEARGGVYTFLRVVVLLLAWAVRLLALAGSVLVLLGSFYVTESHPVFENTMDQLWRFLPWGRIATLSVDTPFGGTFYGDIALMVLALFVIDWLLCKLRAALR